MTGDLVVISGLQENSFSPDLGYQHGRTVLHVADSPGQRYRVRVELLNREALRDLPSCPAVEDQGQQHQERLHHDPHSSLSLQSLTTAHKCSLSFSWELLRIFSLGVLPSDYLNRDLMRSKSF